MPKRKTAPAAAPATPAAQEPEEGEEQPLADAPDEEGAACAADCDDAEEPDEDQPDEEVGDEDADDEPPPPPPARALAPARDIKKLPTGHMPLPVVALDDKRLALDATTLAEAAICAAVFRALADNAQAIYDAILAADEELPPFVMDDADRDLLAALFAKDTAIAGRIRMAAGTTPRDAIAA